MKFSTSNLLTKKNVFKKIDAYSIFKAYCTNFKKIGVSFTSDLPLRPKRDTNASCQIQYIGGDLLYTDFGEGSYRVIPYVMRKFNLSFIDALRKVNADFNLGLIDTASKTSSNNFTKSTYRPALIEKTPTIIDVKYANWTKDAILYWAQYGWTLEMIKRASIRPIDFFWLTMKHRGIVKHPFSCTNELAFTFDFYRHEGVFRRKLYFPERVKERRFSSNVDYTIIQNWDLLPKNGGDTLYITSSKKDTGPFWHLNGWACNSIAPNNEIAFIPEDIFYTKIKPRWKHIVGWLDNDETGINNAKLWALQYGITPAWNPLRAPKDPSDFVKKEGLREFNYLKNTLLC